MVLKLVLFLLQSESSSLVLVTLQVKLFSHHFTCRPLYSVVCVFICSQVQVTDSTHKGLNRLFHLIVVSVSVPQFHLMTSSGDPTPTGELLLGPGDVTGMGRSRVELRGKPVFYGNPADMERGAWKKEETRSRQVSQYSRRISQHPAGLQSQVD